MSTNLNKRQQEAIQTLNNNAPDNVKEDPVYQNAEKNIIEEKNSGFNLAENGLYGYIDNTKKRVGNYIKILGHGMVEGIDNLYLEFQTDYGMVNFALERGHLSDTRGLVKLLLNAGYKMNLESKYKTKLIEYLNNANVESEIIASKQIGWTHNSQSFVLANKVIGNPGIRYFGSIDYKKFCSNGSLTNWKEQVSSNCADNPILELALYAGFSSMLVNFVDFGFGLHINGSSSSGKTTALKVASSIFGNPDLILGKWNATRNGLELAGYNSNHVICCLDEINEADKATLDSIYMLVDGIGKTRARYHNSNIREDKIKRWKTVLLSSGEVNIEDLALQCGKSLKAGESVRMLDISADNVCKDKNHADKLNENISCYYGTASIAFIEYIIKNKIDVKAQYKKNYDDITQHLTNIHQQASRVAKYFALMLTAGNLAIEASIIVDTCNPKETLIMLFNRWLGSNKLLGEAQKVIDTFINALDDQSFFVNKNDKDVKLPLKCIGFIEGDEYFIFPSQMAGKLFKKKSCNKELQILKEHNIISITTVSKKVYYLDGSPRKLYKVLNIGVEKFRSLD